MTVWEDVRGRVVRIVARASTRFGRIRATLARWDGQGLEPEPSRKTWVHRWLPFAIVLVSSAAAAMAWQASVAEERAAHKDVLSRQDLVREQQIDLQDRKSTRLNSSHLGISYAVFCLKKKNRRNTHS